MYELRGKRIFIVEDDPANMAVNAVTLRSTGAIIIQDFWNTDIIRNLKGHLPVDVILLDLMLRHDMTGYDVFRQLQADPQLCYIPVVAVSAADPGVEIPKAQALGLRGFIGKPIVPRLFPKQIEACINGEEIWYARTDHVEY